MLRCICVLLVAGNACYALTERNEYASSPETTKRHPSDDRLPANVVRGRNSSKILQTRSNSSETAEPNFEKKPRTAIQNFESKDDSSCCGNRYNTGPSSRPEAHYGRPSTEGGRYPSQYGERLPVDRYGWQTQGRPAGTSGSTGKPASGGYGGTYGGSAVYAGSLAGDRFSPRPGHGSEGAGRPGSYGYGSSGGYGYGDSGVEGWKVARPIYGGYGASVGGFGVSGTLADGDEFGPPELPYPEGNPPPHTSIQTQKAVALKALAGVALIGAAAALATNPVLLPIGIVAGRRKRSDITSLAEEDSRTDYALRIFRNNFDKPYGSAAANKYLASPRCVGKLTCEIQKKYLADIRKDVRTAAERKNAEDLFQNLIETNVLDVATTDPNVRTLIKMAVYVASRGASCDVFTCRSMQTGPYFAIMFNDVE